VLIVEIMRVNSALHNLIRLGNTRQAVSIITSGFDDGMLLLGAIAGLPDRRRRQEATMD
jgi:Tfp pilus assembly pilus retraction ATPase PilT